jgi:hypothetical protein
LGSNFYVQTHVDNDENKDNSVMNNLNIFIWITNAFLHNRPITYVGGYYKNDRYVNDLISGGYIQLVYAYILQVDLLYHMSLSFLVKFY